MSRISIINNHWFRRSGGFFFFAFLRDERVGQRHFNASLETGIPTTILHDAFCDFADMMRGREKTLYQAHLYYGEKKR